MENSCPRAKVRFPIEEVPHKTGCCFRKNLSKAIWLRLRQLQSVTLARKLIERQRRRQRRRSLDGPSFSPRRKASLTRFATRRTTFIRARAATSASAVLNLYYGSLALHSLKCWRRRTAPRHLARSRTAPNWAMVSIRWTVPGSGLEQIVVGVFSGFFSAWAASIGQPDRRDSSEESATAMTIWHLIQRRAGFPSKTLFASIPEISDLFSDIFESKPRWVTPVAGSNGECRNRALWNAKASRPAAIFNLWTEPAGSPRRTLPYFRPHR